MLEISSVPPAKVMPPEKELDPERVRMDASVLRMALVPETAPPNSKEPAPLPEMVQSAVS